MEKLTIIIPCHNEEKGIGKVIDGIPFGILKKLEIVTEVIVVDNNSTDKTAKVAKKKGAKIITERKIGKGNAVKAGFDAMDKDTTYVVMLDGDNTYKGTEILRMIEPLMNGFCDVVVGSRLGGKVGDDSLKFLNRVANWSYTFLVRQFYGANITDVLSGYFAWKKEVVDELRKHIKSNGFAIEMEMITKIVKLGYEVYSVPITYDVREGETKLKIFSDGSKILFMFFRNLIWNGKDINEKEIKLKVNI